MPVILAIEPDRRQAAQLAGVIRHRVGAELILADTTEHALDAMGDRIPDMVLVPAFLSPQDDAALAAALRVIAAAAHVRTLTIPLLSNGEIHEASGGILSRWRRGRAESPAPDGCDPAVFADQITAYLKETAAERADFEPVPHEIAKVETPELLDIHPVEVVAAESSEPPAAPEWSEPPATPEWIAPPSMPEWIEPQGTLEWIEEPVIEPIEGPVVSALAEEPLIDLSQELAALWETTVEEPERPEAWLIAEAAIEEPVVEESFVAEPIVTEPLVAEPLVAELLEAEPLVDERLVEERFIEEFLAEEPEPHGAPVEPWIPVMLTPAILWPALEGVDAEPPSPLDEFLDEPERRPEPVAAAPARSSPEWTELVASLRKDIERRRGEPAKKQQWQAKKAQPVQDEWGFFDPAQCGFSALLAKLEEITEP